jgi:uncharacterized protein YndB with AHSA1/START domain
MGLGDVQRPFGCRGARALPNESIVITWSGYQARERVEWTFTDRGNGTTYVEIEDSGFAGEPDELDEQAVSATEGFAYTLAGAKAWLEHGLQLNLVPDKFPDRAADAAAATQ